MGAHLPSRIKTWQMSLFGEGAGERKIEECEIDLPEITPGSALVKVAGCGVCGTDLSIFFDNGPTVSRPPLTLGHEISGTVISGDEKWIGKNVVVPTIMPCNKCELCRSGHSNRCLSQRMMGYSFGPYGGFASHIVVPSEDLCEIPKDTDCSIENLAVVADAVATPYQAAKKSNLQKGDKVIIIGVTGGLGIYMSQWARALGASIVIGIGRNESKLNEVSKYGVDFTINSAGKSNISIMSELWGFCKKNKIDPKYSWKIYEMSGTSEGQLLGLELLKYTSTLVIVGYGVKENTYNFSKLMALDSTIMGSWGCEPKHYSFILDKVLRGVIDVRSLVEIRPMSTIVETFKELRKGRRTLKRVVLTPDQPDQ